MRRGYRLTRECSKKCGSTDMAMFTYCCSSTFDIVCQKCHAVESLPSNVGTDGKYVPNPVLDQRGEKIEESIGWIGKTDARQQFHEVFPDKIPAPTEN